MLVKDVIFRQDLYPRINHSPETVQKYAEDVSVLPPIEVNQHGELIDGWHRWTAHKKIEAEEIPAKVTETTSDAHLLELAIERNAAHGLQLSQQDKRDMARKIYHSTPEAQRKTKKDELAKILSVSPRTVGDWLSRIDKDAKEARNQRIFDKWLAGWTVEQIAEVEDISEETARQITQKFADLQNIGKLEQTRANHADDFNPPIYNIWKKQEKTNAVSHFGNSEQQWLDNLLYLYTTPFGMVCDPFAGGGSTIDVCKRRLRRYFVSDRKPIVERENEIRKHDLNDGLPKPPMWKDVQLVYLDPPYWKQAENQYSTDAEDLANMPIEQFRATLAEIVKGYAAKLPSGAHIALIIQPTQWKSEGRKFTDHIGDLLRDVSLEVDMRYSVPYESQQCTAQMVEWAKDNRRCLVLTREIIVWKV